MVETGAVVLFRRDGQEVAFQRIDRDIRDRTSIAVGRAKRHHVGIDYCLFPTSRRKSSPLPTAVRQIEILKRNFTPACSHARQTLE